MLSAEQMSVVARRDENFEHYCLSCERGSDQPTWPVTQYELGEWAGQEEQELLYMVEQEHGDSTWGRDEAADEFGYRFEDGFFLPEGDEQLTYTPTCTQCGGDLL